MAHIRRRPPDERETAVAMELSVELFRDTLLAIHELGMARLELCDFDRADANIGEDDGKVLAYGGVKDCRASVCVADGRRHVKLGGNDRIDTYCTASCETDACPAAWECVDNSAGGTPREMSRPAVCLASRLAPKASKWIRGPPGTARWTCPTKRPPTPAPLDV